MPSDQSSDKPAKKSSYSRLWACWKASVQILVVFLAVFVGYLLGTSPAGVTPPFTPSIGFSAVLHDVPPWPVFRVAVALNNFFKQAAAATTLPKVQIIEQSTAYWRSTIISGLVKNRIVESLNAAGTSGLTCEETASTQNFYAPHLCRILEAATHMNLLTKDRVTGKLTATAAGKLLDHNLEGSMAPFVEMITDEAVDAWDHVMTHSIKSEVSGWESASRYEGKGAWEWYAEHPMEEARFGQAMKAFTKASAGSILADYPFPVSGATICDIGGGIGHTLKLILDHYPQLRGVLFDRPGVADSQDAKDNFQGRSGVTFITGDFRVRSDDWDSMGDCDVFMLKHILHDWDDSTSIEILKNIASIAKPGAKLMVPEHVLGTQVADMELSKSLMDINMMACNPAGASERSVPQYEALFRKAGITGDVTYFPLRDIIGIVEVVLARPGSNQV